MAIERLPGQYPPAESLGATIEQISPFRFTTAAHSARPENNPPAWPESGAAFTNFANAFASGSTEQSAAASFEGAVFAVAPAVPPLPHATANEREAHHTVNDIRRCIESISSVKRVF